jgi:GR25 family glycosyltransferase involved in LPS biosynthesis
MKAICLNLNRRTDRWESVQKQFKQQKIEVERFAAIEHEDPKQSFNLSSIAILQSIKENTIVFEDDVVFVSNKFTDVMANLPEKWDMLYLGGNVCETLNDRVNDYWWRCTDTWTTHAVIYTPKAAKYILSKYDPTKAVYDDFLKHKIQPKLNCYICKPFICDQKAGVSDLWGGHVEYGLLHTQSKLV